MGFTWEIEVLMSKDDGQSYWYGGYWVGESMFSALWNMWQAKRAGFECITLHWRPAVD